MRKRGRSLLILTFCLGIGCTGQAVKSQGKEKVSGQAALSAVSQALGGEPLTEDHLKRLDRELKEDPEKQKAAQSVVDSITSPGKNIRYCPFDGERYSAKVKFCPVHNIQLKEVKE